MKNALTVTAILLASTAANAFTLTLSTSHPFVQVRSDASQAAHLNELVRRASNGTTSACQQHGLLDGIVYEGGEASAASGNSTASSSSECSESGVVVVFVPTTDSAWQDLITCTSDGSASNGNQTSSSASGGLLGPGSHLIRRVVGARRPAWRLEEADEA